MATTISKPDLSITTTEHPNVGRMRAGFDAFSRGDLDAVKATLTDDCTWTNGGTSAIAGTYQGWDQIVGMFGTLLETTGGTFTMSLISTVADDNNAITVYDATSTIKGQTATQRFVMVDEMTIDGRTQAAHLFAYDQAAADAHMNR